jgi:23S rRNA (guanosine2251-2'-O)-methyltransferase
VIVYGRQPVRELLAAGRRPVEHVWATAHAAREPWLAGVGVDVVDAADIQHRAGSDAHQGICAEARPYPYVDAAQLLGAGEDALIVALDEVTDPQNLGAICRTAECAGATGVVILERRSAEVTPAACKASAGAVEYLKIAQVRNVADFLAEAKQAGAWVYGAAAESPVGYDEPDYKGRVVLVMGSEGKGLRPRVAGACDQLISLPVLGHVGSLNVSSAAAAILYEILQSRRRG